MLCILYTICLSTWLGVVGVLVERALPRTSARRWIWCVTIVLSVAIPSVYQARHAMPLSHLAPTADSVRWAWLQAYDGSIYQVWIATSAVLLTWGMLCALRLWYIVHRSKQYARASCAPAFVDGVDILVTRNAGPATIGFWRTRVLIPRWVLGLPQLQRRYVLRHEEEHRRSHDSRLLFLASLFLVLVPWNIAMWWYMKRLRLAVEIDCDNRVVKALGGADLYGNLLLKVAVAGSHGPRFQPGLTAGVDVLERRLKSLMTRSQLSTGYRYGLAIVAAGLLVAALVAKHPVIDNRMHVPSSHVVR